MSNPLNFYATQVFAEQPIALWPLDDTADYVPLIDRVDQDLSNWSSIGDLEVVVNARTDEYFSSDSPPTDPFPEIFMNGVIEDTPTDGGTSSIKYLSAKIDAENFDQVFRLVTFATYLFTYDRTTIAKFGLVYDDDVSGGDYVLRSIAPERQLALVSNSFKLRDSFTYVQVYLEVSFTSILGEPYKFIVHGLNFGQRAEEFILESPGSLISDMPADINIDASCIEAKQYGLSDYSAYYLADSSTVYARNSGMPIVYGSSSSTNLKPFEGKPSLIIPGLGFMNQSGFYKSLTLEFWINVQNDSFDLTRIVGPISSSDGLYVDGPFLKLMLGDYIGSHYVGEWGRPMLVDIRVSPSKIGLVLNGELVIDVDIVASNISLPEAVDESGYSNDWIGFYATDTVSKIQIDCIGIYPYEVPAIVAKRRFVYGQAVDTPNVLNGLKVTNPLYIDKSFAKNAKNYSYPTLGRWSNAIVENIVPNPEGISVPEYSLPELSLGSFSEEKWKSDLFDIQNDYSFLNLKPSSDWNQTAAYLLFESVNILLEETAALYGIYSVITHPTEEQILFELQNVITKEKLGAYLNDDTIEYRLASTQPDGSLLEEVLDSSTIDTDTIFMAGINIQNAISSFGYELSRFFSDKNNIKVFVGGNGTSGKTFDGNIYSFNFSNRRNISKISDEFSSNGIPVNSGTESDGGSPAMILATAALAHVATYSLLPKQLTSTMYLDVAVDCYWEDYVPLSYFAKDVDNSSGEKYKDIDFIQFNIDYPRFNSYVDGKYDSSNSPVRVYATFQYLADGVSKQPSSFTSVELLDKSGVIVPGSDWINTRYEIIDDTIIYPPSGVNFNNLGISIQVEIVSPGIMNDRLKIRSLSFSSRSLGYSPNKIGNRFDVDLYPYKQVGSYTNYKNVSPFSIYKNVVPYLYLAENSGIKIRDDYSASGDRGITLPINKNRQSFNRIGAIQITAKYDHGELPNVPVQIFELESRDATIKFYLKAYEGSNDRGYIYALDSETGLSYSSVTYTTDGVSVRRPVLNSREWTTIGISFSDALVMDSFVGAMRITNPISINNFMAFQVAESSEQSKVAYRKWYAVRAAPDQPAYVWDDWDEFTWQDVLYLTERDRETLDTAIIYKQYTGTDAIITTSGAALTLNSYQYKAFRNTSWSRITLNSA